MKALPPLSLNQAGAEVWLAEDTGISSVDTWWASMDGLSPKTATQGIETAGELEYPTPIQLSTVTISKADLDQLVSRSKTHR